MVVSSDRPIIRLFTHGPASYWDQQATAPPVSSLLSLGRRTLFKPFSSPRHP